MLQEKTIPENNDDVRERAEEVGRGIDKKRS